MKKLFTTLVLCGLLAPTATMAQFQLKDEAPANPDNVPTPVHPIPHERQLKWQETEFYAFFHYGMNTFTGLEWGFGNEAESKYAPKAMPNPEQWVTAVKAAGMNGGIAVVKHHDGFCLWPTATTEHSIKNAGNDNGRNANIPKLYAEASRKHNMKYGFYISPWDRNSAHYGKDTYVTEVFLKQCEELAEYGDDQFEMWFDGARGGDGYYGGEGGTREIDAEIYYDTPNLRTRVHKIAPNCVLWGVGGEARWIGNESGYAGETNWAMTDYMSETVVREEGDINGWFWNPGESDAKATSAGWFWHQGESMKSAERLFQMYLETVGRNATLILNCPPNQYGVLPDNTVTELKKLGKMLHERLAVPVYGLDASTEATDFAKSAKIEVSETRTGGHYEAANLTDGNKETYWGTNDDNLTATITLSWDSPQVIRYLVMQEPVALGQRIKDFKIEYSADGESWTELCPSMQTTTVGYKRIIPLNGKTSESYGSGYNAKKMRITILDSRACPLLSNLSVY
ncbi:MAG: alpha-L-fucosidase [Bacteroidaceae bacterium]|nr:alpha-L-fucosidase [Bacteroidaceae bacterium]